LKLPLGYLYSATYAGIRQAEKDDLALIVSGLPAHAAAVFTQNRVQAAPVKLARRNLKASKGLVGAILVNAGNANCATRTGDKVAADTCRAVAKTLQLEPALVLPASTGVIGGEMDGAKIVAALPRLTAGLHPRRFEDAAHAIHDADHVGPVRCQQSRGADSRLCAGGAVNAEIVAAIHVPAAIAIIRIEHPT